MRPDCQLDSLSPTCLQSTCPLSLHILARVEALAGPTSPDRLWVPLMYLAGSFIAVSPLSPSQAWHSRGSTQPTLDGSKRHSHLPHSKPSAQCLWASRGECEALENGGYLPMTTQLGLPSKLGLSADTSLECQND